MDPILGLLVLVIVVGVVIYIAPMDAPMKAILYKAIGAVVFVLLLLWVLGLFGLVPAHSFRIR